MSKGPDLSAFPIPRKGAARPLVPEPAAGTAERRGRRPGDGEADRGGDRDGGGEGATAAAVPAAPSPAPSAAAARVLPTALPAPVAPPSGQVVATTVKLDESRYLRLAEAGKPGPGRLRRRSIQDMVIEALDEWFARRGL